MTTDPADTGVVGMVDDLLRRASECGASDVHLVPTAKGLEISLRCDGLLSVLGVLEPGLTGPVVGRVKVLADLLAYRTDVPQEGCIPAGRSSVDSEVRVSVYPTVMGEKLAIRLDSLCGSSLELDDLGLSPEADLGLREALKQPEGVVLVTGPSGSGKTTTLYASLDALLNDGSTGGHVRNVVTVEDPVERLIDGVAQTELNPTAGLTYGVALQSLLRQDPDVLLVGEIRDRETAATVLEAGVTGHLVMSTIHAGTCAQTMVRLLEMGMEPFAITSAVRGVLSQRLLRRRCECGGYLGCEKCDGIGFHGGRVLVDEWVPMTGPLRSAVIAREDVAGLEAAVREGGSADLRDRAGALVDNGITTKEEVDRVLGRDLHVGRIVFGRGSGSEPVSSDPGTDVPGERSPAGGPAPVVPRPRAGEPARRGEQDGGGPGAGGTPGAGLQPAAGGAAAPVPGPDRSRHG